MLILDRTLVLSVRVALLGEVVPRLRAVTISARKSEIQLNCYFQDTLIEQDYELASVMSAEIVSDFSTDDDGNWITIKCDALRLDPPEKIPNTGILAYHRYEQDFLLAKEPFPFAMTGEGFRPDIYICFVAWRALLGRILPDFRAIYAFKEKAVIKA